MPVPGNFVALRAGIFVPPPVPGTHVFVESVPGGNLVFGFNPSFALAVRPEDTADLVLQLEHGGTVTITGFFESCDGTFPLLVLPDGEVLSAIDFLRVFDLDMATAAGPGQYPASGGLNEFAEVSGTGLLSDFSGSRLDFIPVPDEAAPEARISGPPVPQDVAPRISIMPVLPEMRPSGPDHADGLPVPAPVLFPPRAEGAPPAFPPVYTVDERGLGLTVDESLMPGGANAANNGAPGYVVSFLVASNNGFASVTVNGTEYAVENGSLAGFTRAAGASGCLSDPAVVSQGNGLYLLTFVYTQGAPHTHGADGKDAAAGVDAISITVNGVLGASGVTSVRVCVADDVPLALDDSRLMAETDASVAGNVLAPTEAHLLLGDGADISGYDGWAESPVTLLSAGRGAYGTLVMESDGSYIYTRNGQGIPDAGAAEVFTYQVTDGDGDVRTATLTINLAGQAGSPDGALVSGAGFPLDSGYANILFGTPANADESGLDDAMWRFAVLNAGSLESALDLDDGDALHAVFALGGNKAAPDNGDGIFSPPVQEDAAPGPAPDGSPDRGIPGLVASSGTDAAGRTLPPGAPVDPESAGTDGHVPNPNPAAGPAWDQAEHLNGQDPAEQARALLEIVSNTGG